MQVQYAEQIQLPQNPIFIVGFPRSGTTLLQAMLATQENIRSFPETHFFSVAAQSLRTDGEGWIESTCLAQVLAKLGEQTELEFSAKVIRQLLQAANERRLNAKALFELIVWQYLVDEPQFARVRWVEKTPDHVRFLERIAPLYPAARFIHIMRNPIYAVYSNKRTPLSQKRSLTWLAEYWRNCIVAYESFRSRHPGSIYSLRYEDLVREPTKFLTEVCIFLGIQFDESRLENYKLESQKLMLGSERWKVDVGTRAIENTNASYQVLRRDALQIQNIAGLQMRNYGYPRLYPVLQSVYDNAISLRNSFSEVNRLAKRAGQA